MSIKAEKRSTSSSEEGTSLIQQVPYNVDPASAHIQMQEHLRKFQDRVENEVECTDISPIIDGRPERNPVVIPAEIAIGDAAAAIVAENMKLVAEARRELRARVAKKQLACALFTKH